MVAGNYNGAPAVDPFPAQGSAVIGAGNPAYSIAIDFTGNPRGASPDAGVNTFSQNGNPGSTIAAEFNSTNGSTRISMPPENVQPTERGYG